MWTDASTRWVCSSDQDNNAVRGDVGGYAVDEEAGFIAAMLADPDDRTVLLVYADWLDERGDPRGEYLRVLESGSVEKKPTWVHDQESYIWLQVIASRKFRVGDRVRILEGAWAGIEAVITKIARDRSSATIINMIGRATNVELACTAFEFVSRPSEDAS
jgi:uncharacterized protein (TIGR02996 family)